MLKQLYNLIRCYFKPHDYIFVCWKYAYKGYVYTFGEHQLQMLMDNLPLDVKKIYAAYLCKRCGKVNLVELRVTKHKHLALNK